jgi:hypothetical protein
MKQTVVVISAKDVATDVFSEYSKATSTSWSHYTYFDYAHLYVSLHNSKKVKVFDDIWCEHHATEDPFT